IPRGRGRYSAKGRASARARQARASTARRSTSTRASVSTSRARTSASRRRAAHSSDRIFGEGPGIRKSAPGEGFNGTPEHFNESKRVDLTGEDIRFTTKGSTLYAFAMGWNRGETRIAALAPARGLERRKIARVELLGSQEPVRWKLASDGLHLDSPGSWPSEHAVAFRILFG